VLNLNHGAILYGAVKPKAKISKDSLNLKGSKMQNLSPNFRVFQEVQKGGTPQEFPMGPHGPKNPKKRDPTPWF
jgi:hypothetical protein